MSWTIDSFCTLMVDSQYTSSSANQNITYQVDFQEFQEKTIYSERKKKKKKNLLDEYLGFASTVFFLEKQNCFTHILAQTIKRVFLFAVVTVAM